jgi:hypothetical protein
MRMRKGAGVGGRDIAGSSCWKSKEAVEGKGNLEAPIEF